MMKNWRIPIALRFFCMVLFSTMLIMAISMMIMHWALQKNFSHYVTQVEIQKLGHLDNNLAELYEVYGSWDKAIVDSRKNFNPNRSVTDDEKRNFSERWLQRQYEIALQQQHLLKENQLKSAQNEHIFIPSHFEPFKRPPQDETDKKIDKLMANDKLHEKKRAWFIPVPDRLSIGHRLALYDANKKMIIGNPSTAQENLLQEILMDKKVVGYIGLRSAIDLNDTLSLNFFSKQQRYLFLIFLILLVISAAAAVWLAAYFKKPIQKLLHATDELSQEHYQYRVDVKSNDELGDLSNNINHLAEVLYQHEQSRKQWVADTSHELKTPISVLQAQIEAMQDGVRKPTPEHFGRMLDQVLSLKKLTQDLADLAQADAQHLSLYCKNINIWEVVRHQIESFKPKFAEKNLQVEFSGESTEIYADPDRFRQVIDNLISNSVRYTEENGKIHIHTELNDSQWILYIDDSPLGLTDEQLEHLGERFYRADDSRTRSTGGTGLGLALSKKIIQLLNGNLQFYHSPLGGLRCKLTLSREINKVE